MGPPVCYVSAVLQLGNTLQIVDFTVDSDTDVTFSPDMAEQLLVLAFLSANSGFANLQ